MNLRPGRRIMGVLVLAAFAVMVGMLPAAALAGTPEDIVGHWAEERIQEWMDRGFIGGYPDGTFRPNREVSRAEFVAFIKRAYEIPESDLDPGLPDVEEGHWFYEPVAASVEAGLVKAYPDGSFRPTNPIARQEAAALVKRLLELEEAELPEPFADQDEIGPWAQEAVSAVVGAGMMGGYPDGSFRPTNPITRAEAVTVLDRGLEPIDPAESFPVVLEVVDEGGRPLEEVLVRLNGREQLSDEDGIAATELEPGAYDYRTEKEGYFPVESGLEVADEEVGRVIILGELAEWLIDAGAAPLYCQKDEDVEMWVKLERGLHPGDGLRIDMSAPAQQGVVFVGDEEDVHAEPPGELSIVPTIPPEGPVILYEPHQYLPDETTVQFALPGDKWRCEEESAWEQSPHDIIFERTDSGHTATAELEVVPD